MVEGGQQWPCLAPRPTPAWWDGVGAGTPLRRVWSGMSMEHREWMLQVLLPAGRHGCQGRDSALPTLGCITGTGVQRGQAASFTPFPMGWWGLCGGMPPMELGSVAQGPQGLAKGWPLALGLPPPPSCICGVHVGVLPMPLPAALGCLEEPAMPRAAACQGDTRETTPHLFPDTKQG